MAIKHFVIDPNGKKHNRVSQNRVYSHCVMVRDSYELALKRAQSNDSDRAFAHNYAYYAALAAGTHQHAQPSWSSDYEANIAKGKAVVAKAANAEEYIANIKAAAVAAVEAAKVAGKYEAFGIYGWCGRRDLAEKLAAKARSIGHFDHVEIVEAQQ